MSPCSHLNIDNYLLYSFSNEILKIIVIGSWLFRRRCGIDNLLNNWFWICIFRSASMRQCWVSLTKITFTTSTLSQYISVQCGVVLCYFPIIKPHSAQHNAVRCGLLSLMIRCCYFILWAVLVSLGTVVQFERFGEYP